MKFAVTGAFSYSGKYIARRLLARGEEVISLTGHPNRPDPFGGKVQSFPLNFEELRLLAESLEGVETLFNTYWVRFDRGANTQPQAVENTRILIRAAAVAGVTRVVHYSITNPNAESHLPYFWGKAANEKAVMDSGMSFAILRPTVLFGKEDILINNIAWLLRRFPLMPLPGNGRYRLQPVYVDDVAELAVECAFSTENVIMDAVGPDILTFRAMVELIGHAIGHPRPLLSLPPRLALAAAQMIGLVVGDVVLTGEEVDGLLADLLVSDQPPRCNTHLADWLAENRDSAGAEYASELSRHY